MRMTGFIKMDMRFAVSAFLMVSAMAGCLCWAQTSQPGNAGSNAPSTSSGTIPVMDGGAGPCSLELTVTADSKPAPAVNVKVHIVYGFAGVRKLDLDAYTNNDGKLKFTGLPSRVRRPPLEFRATKDKLVGTAVYDPESECDGKHGIALVQKQDSQN